jgi:type III secretory pathway component EscS
MSDLSGAYALISGLLITIFSNIALLRDKTISFNKLFNQFLVRFIFVTGPILAANIYISFYLKFLKKVFPQEIIIAALYIVLISISYGLCEKLYEILRQRGEFEKIKPNVTEGNHETRVTFDSMGIQKAVFTALFFLISTSIPFWVSVIYSMVFQNP